MVKQAATTQSSAFSNKQSSFKHFEYNKFITPDRLKYSNVIKTQRPPSTSPKVGPSKREARKLDPFYKLNIDPLDMALNPFILNQYVSEMGKIQGRNITQLTMKNQRRLGKAIRRAKMMGVIPVLSKRNIFHHKR
ncbi:ribosomal protein S18 [Marasmius fiardii PR-910]|nr:ribosomal protein S18 [Marasmius fiardii PR-910]